MIISPVPIFHFAHFLFKLLEILEYVDTSNNLRNNNNPMKDEAKNSASQKGNPSVAVHMRVTTDCGAGFLVAVEGQIPYLLFSFHITTTRPVA